MKFNEFKNMMKVFGVIASTEVIEIERGKFDEEQLYLDNIIFNKVPFSSNCPEKINFPEWIKLNILEILEEILGDEFNFEKVREIVHCPWSFQKIEHGEGKYYGFGLGYSCVLESSPIDSYNSVYIEIINRRHNRDYYRMTLEYLDDRKIIYIPTDDFIYNKEIKEVFPI
jgi:hypothetical protein|nr:MAG TPA: hypothetical protein [Caudoviricetes sp.]